MAEKEKRRRTLSEDEMDNVVQMFIQDHKDKNDNDVVDPVLLSRKYNISLPLVDKVYIKAILQGAPRLDLSRPTKIKLKTGDPYINGRESLIIGKSTIYELNQELVDNQRFKSGDKFSVSLDGEKIVLTRIVE
ncbi:hypothetical protein JCM15519_37990 [Fundidesulfovibrio butyratiphilus]